MKRLILAFLLAVFAASGALGQQIIVTVPGGHDREWYEHHGYVWHDGQWYRANRADTIANGMSTMVTYGETVSGIGANRAATTANGTSTTVMYGTTGNGIGAKGITITTATGKTVTTTVTTKTAIKIEESLPDSVAGSVGSGCGTVQGGWGPETELLGSAAILD